MTINRKALGIAFFATLGAIALAYAATTDQIWNAVFISASNSIRVTATP